MKHESLIDTFVNHFREFLDRLASVPSEPPLKVLKKLGLVAAVDALAKVGAPEASTPRSRVVSFIKQFSCWADGERISLPHLVYALSQDTQPKFKELKEWANESLEKWPPDGHPGPWWIDRDPMPEEVLGLWPEGGKVEICDQGRNKVSLTHERFSHVHLLYYRRNSLAHELLTTVVESAEWDYQAPYYERTRIDGHKTWLLHYPVGFLSTLAGTCLEKLAEWLKAEDINPYKHYKLSIFMLEGLANPVSKDEAVRRLRAARFTQEADELEAWRDVNGNNWGWDGWIRGAHPHVVATIWP